MIMNWTSVKTSMPMKHTELLVTVKCIESGETCVWNGIRNVDGWTIATTDDITELYDSDTSKFMVIAWMYFPDPYDDSTKDSN